MGKQTRRAWNDHVYRMAIERLTTIARDGRPRRRQHLERTQKKRKKSWNYGHQLPKRTDKLEIRDLRPTIRGRRRTN